MGVNLQLMGGSVLLRKYEADGVTLGPQYAPGTTDVFSFSTESESIDHKNTEGEPPFDIDGEEQISIKEILNFETKDINGTFTEMALLATSSSFTQTAATAEAVTLTAVTLDVVEDIGYLDITSLVVKNSTDTTTYVLGTDYTYDRKWGTFIALSTGDIVDAADLHLTLDANAIAATQGKDYIANAVDKQEYQVVFQGRSSKGINERHTWARVSITMNGERPLKSGDAEYTAYSFTGKALNFAGSNHTVKTF